MIYDAAFEGNFSMKHINQGAVKEMCRICKLIASNTDLVKPNGSQCIPTGNLLYEHTTLTIHIYYICPIMCSSFSRRLILIVYMCIYVEGMPTADFDCDIIVF